MQRLRIVLLQDLAVLQPRYPSLPFFAYAPFNGPEWDEFAVAVRSDAVGAMEPLSLLVQYALPELSGVLESTREAVLHNSQRLAIRLEARLEGIQGGLDALLQGKVPVTFTGHFGAGAVDSPYLELQYGSGSGSRASSTRYARRCSLGQGLYSAGCLEGIGGRDCRLAGRTGARRDVGKPLAPGEWDQGAVLSPEGGLGRALGPHGVWQERGGGSCRARALTRRPELEPARRRAQIAPPAGPGPGPDTGIGRDPRAR
ncbi:hypothetical protein FocnCong_v015034 [Fusarium oxysporum f. sp. conglutinans]|nr:hypothetical protein FocnCong_v015034 [Fusarium oxysporum f. sp. conglutinans]